MAITAREVLLTFRAQNYMSGAIRRVGADLGGLSRTAQLANQRAQLNINQQRLMRTRSIAQTELDSINTGSRALAIQKARLGLSKEEFTNAQNLRKNYEAQLSNQASLLRNQNQQSMLQRRLSGQSLMKGEFGGMNQAELQKAYAAAQLDQERLMSISASLSRQEEQLTGTMNQQSLAAQKVAASEAEMYQRQAQLVQQINTTNEALTLNSEKLNQNALALQRIRFENFANGAAKVEHAGRAVQMFGIIAGAAMGYAADQAAKFNTQATIAAAKVKQPGMTVGQIQQNASQIQAQITKLLTSGQAVVSPQDLTTGVYRSLSGLQLQGGRNQQIREAIGLVKQFQNVVKANFGMTDLDQVTQAAITTMRDFGFTTKNVSSALNTMQAAEKYGRMTMGEFLSTFNQAAPAAKAAGYSFKDMSSAIAFLSTKFPSVQTGATGYARLLQTLAQNATKFNQAGYQVTNKAGTQLLPLDQIIKNLIAKQPQLAKGGVVLQNFFKQVTGQTGYIQARRVFTFLAQDLNGLDKVTRQVSGDNTVLAKSIKSAAASPGVKWEEFKNQLRGIVLVLGAGAIPAFKAFAQPLEAAIKWFDNLNPRTQKFIGYMVAMVGIGAALGGTLTAVAGGLARLGTIATASFLGRGGLEAEAGAVNVKFALMFGAIGLLILAFIRFHSQTMAVVNALGGAKDVFGLVFGAVAAISILRMIGYLGKLTKAVYAFRDAEVAAEAVNPFFLIAAAIGIEVVYIIQHFHTLSRGWENMVNLMYRFLVDHFINPTIRSINYFADAWNATLGHIFGGIGKLNQISDSGPFKIKWPKPPNAEAEAFKKAMQEGYLAGTYGMGASTKKDPGGYLTKSQLQKEGYDPYSYGRGASTLSNKAGFLRLGTAADNAFRKTKAYLDQLNKATLDNAKFNKQATQAATVYGTTATLSFKAAYKSYVDALAIAKRFPKNLQDQIKAQQALAKLEAVATKQQIAGARKAATAQVSTTPAWQAATQAGIVATAQYIKLYKAVNLAQAAMAKDPTVANQQAYLRATGALQNYVDAATAANKQIAANASVTFQDVISNIQQMYDSLLQQNQSNFGTLFQGPFINSPAMQNYTQWGGKLTGKDLTKDLQSQMKQFHNFNSLLAGLARRGAPAELIAQLRALGPQAIQQIRALSSMTGPELQKYFNLFRNAQQMIHRQTMRDLNRQLKDYLKYGRNIGLAMAAGIRQESPSITKAIEAMVRKAFPQLGHGPATAGAGAGGHGGTHTHTHHHHHHHHHAHTHHGHGDGGNADTKARHAAFHDKNKHRRNRFHGDRYG